MFVSCVGCVLCRYRSMRRADDSSRGVLPGVSQAALKAPKAVKTTSPLVRQCQQALNDISTRYAVGLYWVPGRAGVRGNEIADRLARGGSVQRSV
jgi:ribonuclease HI